MATAILGNPQLFQDDQIVFGNVTAGTTANKGDWAQWSGGFLVPLGTQASPAYRVSAAGVFLDNFPQYDPLGRALAVASVPVLTHGVIRVSGGSAASLTGAVTHGVAVYPASTASGIIGQTGATGLGAIWLTAPRQQISGNPTGAIASGVGRVINVLKSGDITATQFDVMFSTLNLALDYY